MRKADDHTSEWWDGRDSGTFFPAVYRQGDDSLEGNLDDQPLSLAQRTNRDCDMIESLLAPAPGEHILDCPCGYGRHSVELAKRGYDVTGVDLCPQFIKEARTIALPEDAKCKFVEGDMRSLPFSDGTYSVCVNMFLSFGFFHDDDNLLVLKEFRRVLSKGGRLLIHSDVNPERVDAGRYTDRSIRTLRDGGTLRIDERFDEQSRRLNGEWSISYNNGELLSQEYSVRIYSHDEMKDLLKEAGFTEVLVIYLYDKIDKAPKHSQEIAYVATI